MLIISVEVINPAGVRKPIAKAEVWNESELADLSNYGAELRWDGFGENAGTKNCLVSTVTGFNRKKEAVWTLIRRVIEEAGL